MIYNAEWRNTFTRFVLPRLSVVHGDLTRIAGHLRNSAGVEIWTENPSDSSKVGVGKTAYSLEGWRVAYGAERTSLAAFNTSSGALLQGYDAQAKTALDGYLVSIPAIGTAINNVLNNYRDGSGNLVQRLVSQSDRDAVAAAIEAQLQ